MTDGWIEWKGDREMPVASGDRVDVRWKDGDEFFDTRAGDWQWEINVDHHPDDAAGIICAYRFSNGGKP